MYESDVPGLERVGRGKVRDIYAIDDRRLLIVTTDRLSAYDVVLPDPIPGKGEILTAISNFWFGMMADIVPNHLTGESLGEFFEDPAIARQLESRSILVKRLEPLPIEAVARGYLIGALVLTVLAAVIVVLFLAGLRHQSRGKVIHGLPLGILLIAGVAMVVTQWSNPQWHVVDYAVLAVGALLGLIGLVRLRLE